ncbi:MAG: hypothetical protein QOE70_6159 [Chthoniobacter sp.]|jgi:hypothetical protein|nr:hypothetical protein [Chthoniobacter sp.]
MRFCSLRAWLVWLALSASLAAADYFVATNGLNSNPGTEASPWKTIQKAADTLSPGDRVLVRGGIYTQPVTVNVSGSAAGGYVTFTNYPGETPIIDAAGVTPPTDDTGLFLIADRSYIIIRGFELRNYRTTKPEPNPIGIFVLGAAHHVELRNNNIHHIENDLADGNALGIAIYGTSAAQPMTGVIVDGNEVHHLKTGNSEALVLNGNVTNFEVTNNLVHDNSNIGIDFAGFEKTCPDPAQDQARDGVCRGNQVWNISSFGNPAYGNVYAAGGIYCDGATRVLIERNVSYANDIGVEIASEHGGKQCTFITLRDNLIYRNRIGGLFLGGYDSRRGRTESCTITNNTFFQNDTKADGNGEIFFQYYVSSNTFSGNILVAGPQNLLVAGPYGSNTGNLFDYNLYFAAAGLGASTWQWKGATYSGFAAWKTATAQDAHSIFADPHLVNPTTPDLHVQPGSPAIDAGDPAFASGTGEFDIDGEPRVAGGRVDLGADEQAVATPQPPVTFGAEATAIQPIGATLQARVNPKGRATSVYFEYGETPNYGKQTPAQQIGSGTTEVLALETLSQLVAHTVYYFRLVADNSAGTTHSDQATFSTLNAPPMAIGDAAEALGVAPLSLHPAANDMDADGDALLITQISQGRRGTVSLIDAGTVVYLPRPSFTGSDSFTYTVSDSHGGTATGTVNVTNIFASAAGIYNGLATDPQQTHSGGGSFILKLMPTGRFTGKLFFGGLTYTPFSDSFAGTGAVHLELFRPGQALLAVDLQLDAANGRITGTVSFEGENGRVTSNVMLQLARYDAQTHPAPLADQYTALLPPDSASPDSPQANGYAVLKVGADGVIRITGKLADDTPFTCTAYLQEDGSFPLYSGLYGAEFSLRGSLFGTLTLHESSAPSACTGTLRWRKPPQPPGAFYRDGFTAATVVEGSHFAPARGESVLKLPDQASNAIAHVSGGNLSPALSKSVRVRVNNLVEVDLPEADALAIKLGAKTGLCTGHVYDTSAGETRRLQGVILPKQHRAAGFFLGGTVSGLFDLGPP